MDEPEPRKKRKLSAAEKRARRAADLRLFVKQAGRKAQHSGRDPNDRVHDREVEQAARRMSPEELDRLLREGDDDS